MLVFLAPQETPYAQGILINLILTFDQGRKCPFSGDFCYHLETC